jgi:hypothetical protein
MELSMGIIVFNFNYYYRWNIVHHFFTQPL